MKVKQLRDMLNLPGLGHDDDEVVVYVSDGGFPAISAVSVKSAGFGFDWDSGKLILWPDKPVTTKAKKKKVAK